EQRVHGHALPGGVELRPLGDAVDVLGEVLGGQRPELVPGPALGRVDLAGERERPLAERRVRRGTCRENREITDEILAGRRPVGRLAGAVAPMEAARYECHEAPPLPPAIPAMMTERRSPRAGQR